MKPNQIEELDNLTPKVYHDIFHINGTSDELKPNSQQSIQDFSEISLDAIRPNIFSQQLQAKNNANSKKPKIKSKKLIKQKSQNSLSPTKTNKKDSSAMTQKT